MAFRRGIEFGKVELEEEGKGILNMKNSTNKAEKGKCRVIVGFGYGRSYMKLGYKTEEVHSG